jgi:flagellar protein FliL
VAVPLSALIHPSLLTKADYNLLAPHPPAPIPNRQSMSAPRTCTRRLTLMTKLRHSLFLRYALAALVGCGSMPAHASGGGEAAPAAPTSEYLDLKPAIITNFGGPGPIHFLKAEIALRVGKNPDDNLAVQHHLPQIRHTLVMLLARQTDETLSTMQGKEQIRLEALAAIQKVLQDEEGRSIIADVLFNNLIIQR